MAEQCNNEAPESIKCDDRKHPVCIIVLGMAGSGKTRFVQRLNNYLHTQKKKHQIVNLDPAVHEVPFLTFIDIRDTVNYKEVMKQYALGPNGGIVTSLNLFSTMFDDVMKILAKKENELEYVIFDTPGQIEVFNWSASGPIIAGTLASTYPTIIVYVLDAVRSTNPQTFMSNMLYACSILYKYKLPFIIAMNKIDIVDCKYAKDWMQDFELFHKDLQSQSTYASNLTSSLSLALDEFYKNIKSCGISAMTGEGMSSLMNAIENATLEYEEYRSEYKKLKAKTQSEGEKIRQQEAAKRLGSDLQQNESFCSVQNAIRKETEIFLSPGEGSSGSEEEQMDEDDTEEKKELASFQEFLKQHKEKSESKLLSEVKGNVET